MTQSANPRTERDLIARARAHEEAALRTIVRDNNQRLYRVARSILKDDAEAEDSVQEAYIRAFTNLDSFAEQSSLSTWLTRIVVNEALGRLRRRKPTVELGEAAGALDNDSAVVPFPLVSAQPDPERAMAQTELRQLLEAAIDALPEGFRVVLVARTIEDMSVEETARVFDLKPETVKTRLHRARAMLREGLEQKMGPIFGDVFPFGAARCERMAGKVVERLRAGA